MTIHDIIRKRLLEQAGIFPPASPTPSIEHIFQIQWNPKFELYMRNRMAMGFFRYGSLQTQIGKNSFDNVSSIRHRLDLYAADRNREHLVDIANLALCEFTVHPDFPFNPQDDSNHTHKI